MISRDVDQTEKLGEELGKTISAGTVVWLYGDLGAGKTAFVRGLARGLGVEGRVTSPTFALVNEYEGRLPLFHFDLYRLGGEEDLFELGWDDYLSRGGVCAVEWSQRLDARPDRGVRVDIRPCAEGREICIDHLGA